jgi:uncharacterized protein
MTYQLDWVIKASKLCNLRCQYCYEWDELANKERMSLALWEKVLVAVREQIYLAAERYRPFGGVRARLIWHGGEPLILPIDYVRAVIDLERRILPTEWLTKGTVRNALQTNLYTVSDPMLALLRDAEFGIGVSFDGAPGVRLTASGRQTEERVLANLDRVRKWGFDLGIIVVLAGHTAPRVTEIYDMVRHRVRRIRILPLFDGPSTRPMAGVAATRETLVEALCGLFVRWLEDGCTPAIVPLDSYLNGVIMTMLGLTQMAYDRRRNGDNVFIVNLDGRLFTPNAGYSEPLGDLNRQTIGQILDGEAYQASLDGDDAARNAICGRCDYRGGCNTYPLFSSPDGGIAADRCAVAEPVSAFIEEHLRREGFDEAALAEMLGELDCATPRASRESGRPPPPPPAANRSGRRTPLRAG